MTLEELLVHTLLDLWAFLSSIITPFPPESQFMAPLAIGMISRQSISHLSNGTRTQFRKPRQSANLLAAIHGLPSKFDARETAAKLAQMGLDIMGAELCAIEYLAEQEPFHVAKLRTSPDARHATDSLAELIFTDPLFSKLHSSRCEQARIHAASLNPNDATELIAQLGINSVALAPLIWEGEARGTIVLGSSSAKPFGTAHRRFLEIFSQQAAIALHNCQAYGTLRRQAKDAETMSRVTNTLNSDLPISEALHDALASLLDMIQLPIGVIMSNENRKLECIASLGLTEQATRAYESASNIGIAGACLQEKRPLVSPQIEADPRFSLMALQPFCPKSAVAAPLLIEKRVIGVLMIASSSQHAFNLEEVRAIMMVATQMAWTIERAILLAQVERRAASLSSILEVARTINSNLKLDEVLPIISKEAAQLLGAQASSIMLLEQKTGLLTVTASTCLSETYTSQARIPWGEPIAGWVAAESKPVMIGNIEKEVDLPPAQLANMEREGLISYLGVPLKTKGVTIGVLNVFTKNVAKQFTDEDARLLSTLANQAAVAIENARLFQNEKETVDKLRQLARHRVGLSNMMSHELRTPLTSIKGFAQLLTRQHDIGRNVAERYANIIYSESAKMVDTINALLDLSNMERGLIDLQREPLSMTAVINEAVEDASRSFEDYRFTSQCSVSLPTIRGDTDKIRQILSTLLQISMWYSQKQATISIDAEQDSEGIIVSVGSISLELDEQRLPDLLSETTSIDSFAASDQFRSGALSLYKCQNFIQAHGGKLWIDSQQMGPGSRFRFKLYY